MKSKRTYYYLVSIPTAGRKWINKTNRPVYRNDANKIVVPAGTCIWDGQLFESLNPEHYEAYVLPRWYKIKRLTKEQLFLYML